MFPLTIGEKWKFLIACSAIFSIGHALRILISPYLGILKEALNLSYTGTILLFSSYDIGYIVGLFFVFFLGGMSNVKRGVIITPVIYVFGLLFSFLSNSFLELSINRFILGFATGIYLTHGLDFLSRIFPKSKRGKMMGYHSIGSSAGRLYGSIAGGLLSVAFGWREPFLFLAIVSGLVTVFSMLVLKDAKVVAISERYVQLKRIFPHMIVYSIITFFFLSSISLFPLYFSSYVKLKPDMIGILLGIVTFTTIIVNPIIGIWSDKYGKRKILVILLLFCTILAMCLSLINTLEQAIFFSIILGFVISSPIQVMLAYITYTVDEKGRSSALGFFNGAAFIFALVMLNGMGRLAEMLDLRSAIVAIGLIIIVGIILTIYYVKD